MEKRNTSKVNYAEIKKLVIANCKDYYNNDGEDPLENTNTHFVLDLEGFKNKLNEISLDLYIDEFDTAESKPIEVDDIAFITPFFKKDKYKWLSSEKEYIIATIVDGEIEYDENKDRVSEIAEIESKFPCFHIIVVSYISEDPLWRYGKRCYYVSCRANSVAMEMKK